MSEIDRKDEAHDVDVHIGRQVTIARRIRNCSQEKLADHLQLTFQQVQKYEKGTNRISCGKLYQIAAFLDQPVAFFFPERQASLDDGHDIAGALLATPGGVDVARAIVAITSPADRRLVADFLTRLAPTPPLIALVDSKRRAHG